MTTLPDGQISSSAEFCLVQSCFAKNILLSAVGLDPVHPGRRQAQKIFVTQALARTA